MAVLESSLTVGSKILLSLSDCRTLTGLSRDHLVDAIKAGKLKGKIIGRGYKIKRMQRFIQEAKSASALNHPHILTIHEIGSSPTVREGSSAATDTRFIAMEFIDGETLRQQMKHGHYVRPSM